MHESTQHIFEKIYSTQRWKKRGESEPSSGPGSNPSVAQDYVEFVRQVIQDNKIDSVLDLGHGDWAMWRDYKFEDTSYLGLDVVPWLVERNTQRFGTENVRFELAPVDGLLPLADLFISKDVLQHLANDKIIAILQSMSHFERIIICNDVFVDLSLFQKIRFELRLRTRLRNSYSAMKVDVRRYSKNNCAIDSGSYRGIDLQEDCFSFLFDQFNLSYVFDFAAEHPDGIRKRVYYFVKR
jgi:hypothetical protein